MNTLQQPNPLELIQKLWSRLNPTERKAHLKWTLNQCITCGREGRWEGGKPNGFWCDACCDLSSGTGIRA
jgi:hypothetical protein